MHADEKLSAFLELQSAIRGRKAFGRFYGSCFGEPLDAPEAALESFLIAGRRMIRQHVAAIPANSCGHFILSRARDLLDVARVSNHLRPER